MVPHRAISDGPNTCILCLAVFYLLPQNKCFWSIRWDLPCPFYGAKAVIWKFYQWLTRDPAYFIFDQYFDVEILHTFFYSERVLPIHPNRHSDMQSQWLFDLYVPDLHRIHISNKMEEILLGRICGRHSLLIPQKLSSLTPWRQSTRTP